jgi:hypothetical protein
VVVVTKLFVAEAGAAAAAAVGEDVAALKAFGGVWICVWCGLRHVDSLPVRCAQSIKNKGPAAGLRCRP